MKRWNHLFAGMLWDSFQQLFSFSLIQTMQYGGLPLYKLNLDDKLHLLIISPNPFGQTFLSIDVHEIIPADLIVIESPALLHS